MNGVLSIDKNIPKEGIKNTNLSKQQMILMEQLINELQFENDAYRSSQKNLAKSIDSTNEANHKLQEGISDRRKYFHELKKCVYPYKSLFDQMKNKKGVEKKRLLDYQKNFEDNHINSHRIRAQIEHAEKNVLQVSLNAKSLMETKKRDEKIISTFLELMGLKKKLIEMNKILREKSKELLSKIDYQRLKHDFTYRNRVNTIQMIMNRIENEIKSVYENENLETFDLLNEKLRQMNDIYKEMDSILSGYSSSVSSEITFTTIFNECDENNSHGSKNQMKKNRSQNGKKNLLLNDNLDKNFDTNSIVNTSSIQIFQSPIINQSNNNFFLVSDQNSNNGNYKNQKRRSQSANHKNIKTNYTKQKNSDDDYDSSSHTFVGLINLSSDSGIEKYNNAKRKSKSRAQSVNSQLPKNMKENKKDSKNKTDDETDDPSNRRRRKKDRNLGSEYDDESDSVRENQKKKNAKGNINKTKSENRKEKYKIDNSDDDSELNKNRIKKGSKDKNDEKSKKKNFKNKFESDNDLYPTRHKTQLKSNKNRTDNYDSDDLNKARFDSDIINDSDDIVPNTKRMNKNKKSNDEDENFYRNERKSNNDKREIPDKKKNSQNDQDDDNFLINQKNPNNKINQNIDNDDDKLRSNNKSKSDKNRKTKSQSNRNSSEYNSSDDDENDNNSKSIKNRSKSKSNQNKYSESSEDESNTNPKQSKKRKTKSSQISNDSNDEYENEAKSNLKKDKYQKNRSNTKNGQNENSESSEDELNPNRKSPSRSNRSPSRSSRSPDGSNRSPSIISNDTDKSNANFRKSKNNVNFKLNTNKDSDYDDNEHEKDGETGSKSMKTKKTQNRSKTDCNSTRSDGENEYSKVNIKEKNRSKSNYSPTRTKDDNEYDEDDDRVKSSSKNDKNRKSQSKNSGSENDDDDHRVRPSSRNDRNRKSKSKRNGSENDDDDYRVKPSSRNDRNRKSKSKRNGSENDDDDYEIRPSSRNDKHKTSQSKNNRSENDDDDDRVRPSSRNDRNRKSQSKRNGSENDDDDDKVRPSSRNDRNRKSQSKSNRSENNDDDDKVRPSSRNDKHKTSRSKSVSPTRTNDAYDEYNNEADNKTKPNSRNDKQRKSRSQSTGSTTRSKAKDDEDAVDDYRSKSNSRNGNLRNSAAKSKSTDSENNDNESVDGSEARRSEPHTAQKGRKTYRKGDDEIAFKKPRNKSIQKASVKHSDLVDSDNDDYNDKPAPSFILHKRKKVLPLISTSSKSQLSFSNNANIGLKQSSQNPTISHTADDLNEYISIGEPIRLGNGPLDNENGNENDGENDIEMLMERIRDKCPTGSSQDSRRAASKGLLGSSRNRSEGKGNGLNDRANSRNSLNSRNDGDIQINSVSGRTSNRNNDDSQNNGLNDRASSGNSLNSKNNDGDSQNNCVSGRASGRNSTNDNRNSDASQNMIRLNSNERASTRNAASSNRSSSASRKSSADSKSGQKKSMNASGNRISVYKSDGTGSSKHTKLPILSSYDFAPGNPSRQQQHLRNSSQLGKLQFSSQWSDSKKASSSLTLTQVIAPKVKSQRPQKGQNGTSLTFGTKSSDELQRSYTALLDQNVYPTEFTGDFFINEDLDKADRLKHQILENNEDLMRIEEEIGMLSEQCKALSKKSASIQTKVTSKELASIDHQLLVSTDLTIYHQKISELEIQLAKLNDALKKIEDHNLSLDKIQSSLKDKLNPKYSVGHDTQPFLAARRLRIRFELALKHAKKLNGNLEKQIWKSKSDCSDYSFKIKDQEAVCSSLRGAIQGQTKRSADDFMNDINQLKEEEMLNQEQIAMHQIELNMIESRIAKTQKLISTQSVKLNDQIEVYKSKLDTLKNNFKFKNRNFTVTSEKELKDIDALMNDTQKKIIKLDQRKIIVVDNVRNLLAELESFRLKVPSTILIENLNE